MLPLCHMGVGARLVKPWTKELPTWALLFGTVLPDLIDKPLFYALLFWTRFHGETLGYINNSRTLAHTGIFLIALTGFAVVSRSKTLAAISLGVATHLLLDNVGDALYDYFMPDPAHPPTHSAMVALLWPVFKSYFPQSPFNSLAGHFSRSFNPLSIGAEIAGGGVLFWDSWQRRHESEIIQALLERRRLRRERKRLKKRQSIQ